MGREGRESLRELPRRGNLSENLSLALFMGVTLETPQKLSPLVLFASFHVLSVPWLH